ncbi:hypothetical protein PAHAL_1G446000 [Panicum hallii]|uniref:Uncharacterized protein n=1 Tax=Panicum hallii TaxID=206008 RepID=A0A2T8KYD2_9POAL|nr:hypothetical protein PAHAL_1G446000 [Panicum hallii]
MPPRPHSASTPRSLCGNSSVPFTVRAHYDRDLEIFVGLSKDPAALGHLCFCGMNSLNTSSSTQCPAPAWKLCQEKLFSNNPGEERVSAILVYMGSESKFCLVECIFVCF